MLADTYGNKPQGSSFIQVVNQWPKLWNEMEKVTDVSEAFDVYSKYEDKSLKSQRFISDSTKLNLIYAQTHKFASLYPDAIIAYDFYDDREDILNGLEIFFKHNPDLLPKNLILRLHHYDGAAINTVSEIQGKGEIDHQYESSIKAMLSTELCGNALLRTGEVRLAQILNGDKLLQFKSNRDERLMLTQFRERYGQRLRSDIHGCFSFFRSSRLDYLKADLTVDEVLKHALYENGGRTKDIITQLGWVDEKSRVNSNYSPVLLNAMKRVQDLFGKNQRVNRPFYMAPFPGR
ncbi:hypothetical protein COXBURSA334_1645 [Coxiella burnetii Q321]|nr:hypothetical protein COXBURSA334_1645 [Coxiella burnetii Q321]